MPVGRHIGTGRRQASVDGTGCLRSRKRADGQVEKLNLCCRMDISRRDEGPWDRGNMEWWWVVVTFSTHSRAQNSVGSAWSETSSAWKEDPLPNMQPTGTANASNRPARALDGDALEARCSGCTDATAKPQRPTPPIAVPQSPKGPGWTCHKSPKTGRLSLSCGGALP